MNYKEIGRGGIDWIYLAQERDAWLAVIYMVMNILIP